MSFVINSGNYIDYIERVAEKISKSGSYISSLDAATGDGDHWVNINLGFEHLVAAGPRMRQLSIYDVFRQIGVIMMSKVGGSSGILYGGAYLAAGKSVEGKNEINDEDLCLAMEAMVNDMMTRGNAKPGYKTMIDSLYPAVVTFKKAIAAGTENRVTMEAVKRAAVKGAEATRTMEAVKGRASYRTDKGVGFLDPGAVTMSYQIECLCDYICDVLL